MIIRGRGKFERDERKKRLRKLIGTILKWVIRIGGVTAIAIGCYTHFNSVWVAANCVMWDTPRPLDCMGQVPPTHLLVLTSMSFGVSSYAFLAGTMISLKDRTRALFGKRRGTQSEVEIAYHAILLGFFGAALSAILAWMVASI